MRLAILALISSFITFSCAHLQKDTLLTSKNDFKGLKQIEKDNPPSEGVYMSWDDAYIMAYMNKKERLQCQEMRITLTSEIDKLKSINNDCKKTVSDVNTSKWWATWGMPIGIISGIVIGATVPLIVIGVQR